MLREQDRITGVKAIDHITGEEKEYHAEIVINAGGIWGHGIAAKAGIEVKMLPAKGSLLIFGHRVNNIVLNRCRKPSDADILVPGDTISLIGTTSDKIPYDRIDNFEINPEEVDILLREGEKLAPKLAYTRILRAYAGVRPLVASDNDPTGRTVSRGIVLLDHAERDGMNGFIIITGGKLMTYRLMAEWATDLACKKLGMDRKCKTASLPLPGSEDNMEDEIRNEKSARKKSAILRHGNMARMINEGNVTEKSLVCECEEVSVGEINYALDNLDVNSLVDLRRRTRVGMGTCQGELCACRAAGLMSRNDRMCAGKAKAELSAFLRERWKGMAPIAWGDTLRESEYTSWIYESVCGINEKKN